MMEFILNINQFSDEYHFIFSIRMKVSTKIIINIYYRFLEKDNHISDHSFFDYLSLNIYFSLDSISTFVASSRIHVKTIGQKWIEIIRNITNKAFQKFNQWYPNNRKYQSTFIKMTIPSQYQMCMQKINDTQEYECMMK